MEETTYAGVARLVAQGAPLDQIEAFIERRAGEADEERRSALWLQDWHALERGNAGRSGADLLDTGSPD